MADSGLPAVRKNSEQPGFSDKTLKMWDLNVTELAVSG